MDEIHEQVPCRHKQLNDLVELMGEDDEPLPASLFISGSMATGKSLCINAVLKHLRIKYVIIDCIECYMPKIMYEAIVTGLYDDQEDVKCDTLMELINNLNAYGLQQTNYEPIVLVFDKAETFRNMDYSIMSTFLRLREFCNLNICTIFVTHLIYEHFFFKMGVREPIKIYFRNYNKDELFKIIFLHQKSFVRHLTSNHDVDCKTKEDLERPELFANFLNAFLSVFYRPCRDLIELRHMAKVNFVKYCKPIILNEIKSNDLPKLWRHIAPILKTSLQSLYLRTSTMKPFSHSPCKKTKEKMEPQNCKLENMLRDELSSTKSFAQTFDLPYYAKYLLIAAYLASYNPPKEDKRLFMKNHGKQRKRMQQVKAKAKINEKLNTQLGPKVFTHDRWLAIFYVLLEERIAYTHLLLAETAALVQLRLIAESKEIDLNTSKYKCIVGYDFISAIAQTVGFNIRKYLYDFI